MRFGRVQAGRYQARIINCGSIGQPRDSDPRSSYIIFDSRTQILEFYRVDYDIAKSAKAIKTAGLPSSLSRRLLKGI